MTERAMYVPFVVGGAAFLIAFLATPRPEGVPFRMAFETAVFMGLFMFGLTVFVMIKWGQP